MPRRSVTADRLERHSGALATAAIARMDERLPWYRAMPPEDRSWVGLVAQAGIAAFIQWLRHPSHHGGVSADVFGTAPRELTRSVSLQQTVELVRVVIEVVEERIDQIAAAGDEVMLREAVLRYSREIAFAAAQVYAEAAEARGAWDARLEALVVDALVRGEIDDAVRSRAGALGWSASAHFVVIVGAAPGADPEVIADDVRHAGRTLKADVLAGVLGDRLIVVLGGIDDPYPAARKLAASFGPGPVVVSPVAADLGSAGGAAREALAALAAARAWPDAPRPVGADELLPERALAGDDIARQRLVDDVYAPLAAGGPALVETLSAYLEHAASLESAARMLFVHPNTVRYRLRRVAEITGCTPSEPRDAFALRLALVLGRLDGDRVSVTSQL